jgi:hypothetical protein
LPWTLPIARSLTRIDRPDRPAFAESDKLSTYIA